MCEELILTRVAHHNRAWDSNPSSHGCKPSALPLCYPLLQAIEHLILCLQSTPPFITTGRFAILTSWHSELSDNGIAHDARGFILQKTPQADRWLVVIP